MSEAELQMILSTLEKLSGTASDAAMWWFVMHYGTKIVGYMVVPMLAIIVGIIALKIVKYVGEKVRIETLARDNATRGLVQVAAALGMTLTTPITERDSQAIYALLNALKDQDARKSEGINNLRAEIRKQEEVIKKMRDDERKAMATSILPEKVWQVHNEGQS